MTSEIPEIGQLAPGFQTKNANGQVFKLETILKKTENLMLVFYRGHW